MTLFDRQRHAPEPTLGLARPDGLVDGGFENPPGEPWAESAAEETDQTGRARARQSVSILRVSLLTLAALTIGLALNLVLISRLEQSTRQFKELGQFRFSLAAGTAPIGPLQGGKPLALGTPMALLTIPSIGLKQVVDEGTNSEVLLSGPGHLPSSAFPGGLGTSVIYGRASTYGGPFARIGQLRKGARIMVTIQNAPTNTAVFRVSDIRTGGQKIPPIGRGGARLTLVTAKESMFVPSGVVYVDANIVGTPLPTHFPVVTAKELPANELPLGIDTGNLWLLVLWLVVLAGVATGALWTWNRKGRPQAWIIFLAPAALVGYLLANQIALLLPNVM
jgi:sortase A